jgi:2-keto-4-pentenoate hydratase
VTIGNEPVAPRAGGHRQPDDAGAGPARQLATRLHAAHRDGLLLDAGEISPPRGSAEWTLELAYDVQDELTALRLAEGRRLLGYKLGYTSAAMRRQMGVPAPNFGPLYADMLVADGGQAEGFVQPRVEPEVAVVLARDLAGTDLQLHEVAAAVGEVRASLEIVDSVWRDYSFTAELNTADGSSAAGVVVGADLGLLPMECHRPAVLVRVDGEVVASARASAASGHPLLGISWLCRTLAARGLPGLRAGQVIITGGLTAALPLASGARITAEFTSGVAVSVSRP